MGQYRRHATSKATRKNHHRRMKKRFKGTGIFPYADGRGKTLRQLSRISKSAEGRI